MSTKLTKDKADELLKAFAKELRKSTKKQDINIIIVGGGSILLNYNFHSMTDDFDIIKPNLCLISKKRLIKLLICMI